MKTVLLFLVFVNFSAAQLYGDIFVVKHEWHTGIVVKTKDLESSIWYLDPLVKSSDYIEFGWGDEQFYKSGEPSIWLAIKAVLIPTSSVLHVEGVTNGYLNSIDKQDIAKLTLSRDDLFKLLAFIDDTFEKKQGRAVILSKGLYSNSLFYLSNKSYHIFNTCNIWTAEALQKGGVDIDPAKASSAEDLFLQLKQNKGE
ncbi:MAG: DUF2459 domain-containing protein [Campylobacterota bacterium]|nr:DUF2459 domain-containing protein [Campylobacterota bacterium]